MWFLSNSCFVAIKKKKNYVSAECAKFLTEIYPFIQNHETSEIYLQVLRLGFVTPLNQKLVNVNASLHIDY